MAGGVGGEGEDACVDKRREAGPDVLMNLHVGEVMVVQAGAFQMLVIQQEAQRFDQVEREPGARAEADRVAGVAGDDGVVEDHVHAA